MVRHNRSDGERSRPCGCYNPWGQVRKAPDTFLTNHTERHRFSQTRRPTDNGRFTSVRPHESVDDRIRSARTNSSFRHVDRSTGNPDHAGAIGVDLTRNTKRRRSAHFDTLLNIDHTRAQGQQSRTSEVGT